MRCNANITKANVVTFWLQMLCCHVHLQSPFQQTLFASHGLHSLQMVQRMVQQAGRWFLYSRLWLWDYPWNFNESLGENKRYTLIMTSS